MTETVSSKNNALAEALSGGALAGTWTLDSERSTASLTTKAMWGLAPVRGSFTSLEGSGAISPTGAATGTFTIVAPSLSTKNTKRDTHLHSADFLHVEKYPTITFTLDRFTPTPDGITVDGALTVREVTRPLSFPATVSLAGTDEATIDATVTIDRSHYGLTWNRLGMASMVNTITIHATYTKS
jgi:polyisoprenoid-binding protein YceI